MAREKAMYAVIRRYSGQGASRLMDELVPLVGDIEAILRSVPGFASYTLTRTGDGGASVGVFRDKAGADESSRQAAAFIRDRLSPEARIAAEVSEGEVVLHIDHH